MLTIFIDGDACPVKEEALRVAQRHNLEVFMVSNGGLRPSPNPKVHIIVVSSGADMADNWIAERIEDGDIAVTADILLADRCLKKGAEVISTYGRPFTDDNIGSAKAMRDLNAHLRETGEMTGGNASFGKQDRSRFLQSLEEAVQRVKRG
ncbi:MAG: hypothetical protein K0R98_1555 [Rickettsiaceae bacterium]|jgi:uncharacterized protein YaiI (UPF0178 family)|nr:hypothetical protein [Rickettsiaceae bacterium]